MRKNKAYRKREITIGAREDELISNWVQISRPKFILIILITFVVSKPDMPVF